MTDTTGPDRAPPPVVRAARPQDVPLLLELVVVPLLLELCAANELA